MLDTIKIKLKQLNFTRIKQHKVVFILIILLVVAASICSPIIYRESWLDPFSTLNVPNKELKPNAITTVGILSSDDPFHSYYYTDAGEIRELMHNLRRAVPLPASEQTIDSLEKQKIQYFTLHRPSSNYHSEEDFSLQYYPEKGIVYFGQQFFKINEATIYSLSKIYKTRTAGWWK